ncbi:hypothetical protein NEOKW01_1386 [Nematocida sp. AWRm80]|nr:hypothetical protein NEOKW01_1386 [Nematocida sp. AWRm80]
MIQIYTSILDTLIENLNNISTDNIKVIISLARLLDLIYNYTDINKVIFKYANSIYDKNKITNKSIKGNATREDILSYSYILSRYSKCNLLYHNEDLKERLPGYVTDIILQESIINKEIPQTKEKLEESEETEKEEKFKIDF